MQNAYSRLVRLAGPERSHVRVRRVVMLFALSTLWGCAKEGDARTQTPSTAVSDESGIPSVLATIGDEPITLDDVRRRIGEDLDKIETQYLRARSRLVDTTLESMIRERVLQAEAKRQGKTVEEVIAAAAGAPIEPSDVEITAWYQENQARLRGRSLEQLRPQIAGYLRTERSKAAYQQLEQRIKKDLKVTVNFQPYRLRFANEGAPTMGREGAPVTLVEFSDFQCPYCQGFAPILKRVQQEYPDKVQIVYRQYPIASLHPFAIKAAEASLCAHEQGKFWEMHDLMFNEQQRLGVSDLKEKASRLGMNQKKFDGCLDSGRFVERIQNDLKEGARAGITGTPAVFVNGTIIEGGAVPYERVAAAIDKELARLGQDK